MGMTVIFVLAALAFFGSAFAMVALAGWLAFYVLGFFWTGVFFLAITCLYCGSVAWAWRDAGARGRPSWAAAVLVAVGFWPAGLLLWILFRPEKKIILMPTKTASPPASLPPVTN